MITSKTKEEYGQFFYSKILVTGTPETYDYQKVETGLTTLQKVAFEISQIEYNLPADFLSAMPASSELNIAFGLASQPLNPYGFYQRSTILRRGLMIGQLGSYTGAWATAGEIVLNERPLVVPQSMYVFAGCVYSSEDPLAAVELEIELRFWYRTVELKDSEYWDLVQLLNPLGM